MVYILSMEGRPLMPTDRHGKVRRLLKEGKAKVVKAKPFTIQLLYKTKEYIQPVTLGIDSGYTYIGFSAITEKKEFISGEVKLRNDVNELIKERRMYRKIRRNRLRYRKPRFDNRKKCNNWLAPSIQHKLDSHIRFIEKLKKILPITNIIVEVANFDTQKIKNLNIQSIEYQQGEQQGFWNIREYILYRDNYTFQLCGKKDVPLEVHHIGYWIPDRTDRPDNLITLCTKCHTPKNHKEGGKLWGMKPKNKPLKEATFMSIVRWKLVNILNCKHTYGYITKSKRIVLNLEKTHYNDAFCIAGGTNQERTKPIMFEQVRRNNRSLEKFYDAKYMDIRTGKILSGQELFSGRRCRNKNLNSENLRKYRCTKKSKGRRSIRTQRYFYQPKDVVVYNRKYYIVKGIQNKGDYIKLEGLSKPVKVKLVKPYMFRKGICVI